MKKTTKKEELKSYLMGFLRDNKYTSVTLIHSALGGRYKGKEKISANRILKLLTELVNEGKIEKDKEGLLFKKFGKIFEPQTTPVPTFDPDAIGVESQVYWPVKVQNTHHYRIESGIVKIVRPAHEEEIETCKKTPRKWYKLWKDKYEYEYGKAYIKKEAVYLVSHNETLHWRAYLFNSKQKAIKAIPYLGNHYIGE